MVAPMDLRPDISAGKSPRQELQGPRPTPLKIRKESRKIRKPPVAPTQQPPPPPPPPVIIYTVSPKIIHANASEFMTLVQRLTGPDSTYTSSSVFAPPSSKAFHDCDAMPPVAPPVRKPHVPDVGAGIDGERPGFFPAVLSANLATLQPIPSNLFSPPPPPPPSDQNALGFFPDLSPLLHSNKNYLESSLMMPSSSTSFISPRIISPTTTPSMDLLSNLFDLQHFS